MEVIWEQVQEWQMSWDSWKVVTFGSLQTETMGLQAQGLLKRLNKVSREVKVGTCKCTQQSCKMDESSWTKTCVRIKA